MPLRDVLSLTADKDDADEPITATLVENITQILAEGDAEAGTYDSDEILTAVVYAVRAIEVEMRRISVTQQHILKLLPSGGDALGAK